jgi:predicted MFS family arabinose efflux permease
VHEHSTNQDDQVIGQGERSSARRLPIIALIGATGLSLIGSQLSLIALPWFVLQTTGSAVRTALTGFGVALSAFAFGVLGGPLVDRLGYRRTSVAADLISGASIALIPLLYFTIGLAYWQLLVLVSISAMSVIPGLTARRSMLPNLAHLGRLRLEQVNGAFEGMRYFASLVGAPIAGLLIVSFGAVNVFWIDATSFAASALIVLTTIPTQEKSTRPSPWNRYPFEVVKGLQYLQRDHLLFALVVGLATFNLLGAPGFAVILPVYATSAFGQATSLGLMVGAFGAGAVVGALLFAALGDRLPRRFIWVMAFMVAPLEYWVLAMRSSLPVILAVFAIVGISGGAINPLSVTIRHERIPPHLRGRVFAAFTAVAGVTVPLGVILGGLLINWVGFQPTILALAVSGQLVGIGVMFLPTLREMDQSRISPA